MADAYQGWTNRETWAAHLHLTNSRNTHAYWSDEIERLRRESWSADLTGYRCMASWVRASLADLLKDAFENVWGDACQRDGALSAETAKCLSDIGSLWRVNWDEIAKALTEDAP